MTTTFKNKQDVNVLFMGTPIFAAKVLEALIAASFNVVGVITQEDKAVGRKKILTPSPAKVVALEHNIPVFQPHRIRLDFEFAKTINFDVIVTAAYGQLIPEELIALARYGAYNLHGSLLPSYRGAAPIQRAIMAGNKETGITLMEMVAAMDAGKMYEKSYVEITKDDDFTSLNLKLAEAAGNLIVKDLLPLANGEIIGEEQDKSQVSIAKKIKPEHEHLPLELLTASQACCYVRGLSEEPGAYVLLEDKKLKIYRAEEVNSPSLQPFEAVCDKKHLYCGTASGTISLLDVQLDGKKRMNISSFLCGARLEGHFLLK